MNASIDEAEQEFKSSAVDLEYFKENYAREKDLIAIKAISETEFKNTQRLYNAKLAAHSALAAKIARLKKVRDAEESEVFNAQKSFETQVISRDHRVENSQISAVVARSAVAAAEAEYKLASLNLEHTRVKAKNAGYVTNRRISAGEYIQVGQRIASITSCHARPWVNANFKETQVGRMRKGQKAEFTIDTYPGVTFEGVVESISSGSGSTFSVLPPENASGNFTKVVKRMPVKISFAPSKDLPLRVGSSVQVAVFLE
jgi:membrane fusion protein (multidrug efflux system)